MRVDHRRRQVPSFVGHWKADISAHREAIGAVRRVSTMRPLPALPGARPRGKVA